MKKFLLPLLFSFSAYAIEIKFIGPCEDSFIMKTEVTDVYENVGQLTIETLKKFNIPHTGTYAGLSSAFETPVGEEAMEIVSETEVRAYGWCYSVDGISPEVYPDEALITPETKSVVWHFGYARVIQGEWITQCTPAWEIKPAFLCKDPVADR